MWGKFNQADKDQRKCFYCRSPYLMLDISDLCLSCVRLLIFNIGSYDKWLHASSWHTQKNTHSIPTIHILLLKLIAAITVVWPVNPVKLMLVVCVCVCVFVVSISTHLHLCVSCVSVLCTIQYINSIKCFFLVHWELWELRFSTRGMFMLNVKILADCFGPSCPFHIRLMRVEGL